MVLFLLCNNINQENAFFLTVTQSDRMEFVGNFLFNDEVTLHGLITNSMSIL